MHLSNHLALFSAPILIRVNFKTFTRWEKGIICCWRTSLTEVLDEDKPRSNKFLILIFGRKNEG